MTTSQAQTPSTPPSRPPETIRFSVEYQEGVRDKAAVALRIFMIIPIAFILSTIGGGTWGWEFSGVRWEIIFGSSSGVLFVGPALMMAFRQKYPRWWWDFNIQLLRFEARVISYLALMRDEYPSTDEEQKVHLDADYPDIPKLNQYLPLVKWFLAIPHLIVLAFLTFGAVIVVIVAWFSILINGQYPRGMFDYVEKTMRYGYRVIAYAFLLNTDVYPRFSLD